MSNIAKNKSKYKFLWSNIQSLLTLEMNMRGFEESEVLLSKANNVIEVSRNNRLYCYHSLADLDFDAKEGKKVFSSKKNAKNFFQSSREAQDKHKRLYKKLLKVNYSLLSNEEIFTYYSLMVNDWIYLVSHFRGTQAEPTNFLMKRILKNFSEEESSLLTLSAKIDPISKELIDWQKILESGYSKNKIKEHLLKHPWVVAAHFSYEDIEKTMQERFRQDRKTLLNKNILKEKKELRNKHRCIFQKKPRLKETIRLVQDLALNRLEIKACWAGMDFYLLPLIFEVAKRKGIESEIINKYYLVEDFKKLIFENKILTKKEISKRKKCFVGLWKNGKVEYKSGKDGEELARKELGNLYESKKKDSIKGIVANSGKVIAVARILISNNIENSQKLRKNFKKGQILVTQMTQPNIMDIASRAGGIITDEGGLLSHAAIISRELKIPCIVGTSIATDLIKDGDLVEVDANQGVVRIIKKA